MLKAEADNSYLDLDYSGLKKLLFIIFYEIFQKLSQEKQLK